MDDSTRQLSPSEKHVFDRLFQCEFPGRDALRLQLEGLLVTQLDGNGWLALQPTRERPAEVRHRVPIEGSYADVDGILIHVLLHVVDGYLRDLEFFKEDGSNVVSLPEASKLKLFCPTGGEPD